MDGAVRPAGGDIVVGGRGKDAADELCCKEGKDEPCEVSLHTDWDPSFHVCSYNNIVTKGEMKVSPISAAQLQII